MNKDMLDTLNELSKKPTTELALSYMEVVADNMEKDKEIERLNNQLEEKNYLYNKLSTESEYAINKLNKIINNIKKEYEIFNQSDFNENNCITFINRIEKELKEGK